MAVIEYDEYKQKLQALEPTLQELEKALAIPKAREELAQLQKETEQEGFWSDVERSQKVSQQIKRLESKVRKYDRLVSDWEDTLLSFWSETRRPSSVSAIDASCGCTSTISSLFISLIVIGCFWAGRGRCVLAVCQAAAGEI